MINGQYNNYESNRVVTEVLYRVFAWMAGAIGLSAATAYLAADHYIFQTFPMMLVLLLVQVGIVVIVSGNIVSLPYSHVQGLFLTYAVLSGLTGSAIFRVYELGSIIQLFFATAGMFLVMAIYGYVTRVDLTQYQSLLYMVLWGVIIALLINMFLGSSQFQMLISIVGVLLFSALTAYDVHIIARMARTLLDREVMLNKIAILCALQLYLDFINLFLSMLQLFGKRK